MRIVSGFIIRQIAGETVAIPSGASAQLLSGLVALNGSAQLLFQLLQTEQTADTLVHAITDSYEIDLAAPVTPTFSDTKDGLDEEKKPIPGLFFIYTPEKEDPDSTEAVAPVIKINVPENCEAYYEWEKS